MTDHALARHTLGTKPATSGPPVTGMWESPKGEWVKYDEAAARIADLQRQLDELVEAVRASDRAHHAYQHARATGVDPEVVDNALFDNMARASLRLSDLVDRIKPTQPKESRDG